jgi:hypothetical protein
MSPLEEEMTQILQNFDDNGAAASFVAAGAPYCVALKSKRRYLAHGANGAK